MKEKKAFLKQWMKDKREQELLHRSGGDRIKKTMCVFKDIITGK